MAEALNSPGDAGADGIKLPGVYLPETGLDGLAPGGTAVLCLHESVCDRFALVLPAQPALCWE